MAILDVTARELLSLGLILVGFDEAKVNRTCDATNLLRFVDRFGAYPEGLVAILRDLDVPNMSVAHFLMTMNWLKTHS